MIIMEKLVKIKSKQSGITVRHFNNPSFQFTFGDEPIEVTEEIAEFLIKTNSTIELVGETKKKSKREVKK